VGVSGYRTVRKEKENEDKAKREENVEAIVQKEIEHDR
jgi:hypothetical protein